MTIINCHIKNGDNGNCKYDLGWGHPYFLLKILEEFKININAFSAFTTYKHYGYSDENGDGEKVLKRLLKSFINTYINQDLNYQYLLITNGATNAISLILQYLKNEQKIKEIITGEMTYIVYPHLINAYQLEHKTVKEFPDLHTQISPSKKDIFYLIDSPSNPLGKIATKNNIARHVIWDSVYHNKVYLKNEFLKHYPSHVMGVGSFSKIFGLGGVRIGWVGLNDYHLYKKLKFYNFINNVQPNSLGQRAIIYLLNKLDLFRFFIRAKQYIDYNRELINKIIYLFDYQPVSDVGQFYCAFADKKSLKILDKCQISYLLFDNNMIRLNLGQDTLVLRKAVGEILKYDKTK